MNQYTTLFEQQSYRDALDFFMESLTNEKMAVWDYVILTASNEDQARSYEIQIEHRLGKGQISERTQYAVIPDLDGQRVGSGGATFSAIRYVKEHTESGETCRNPFAGKRILVIHSGGDSKRVPQYSACGKLFSPVPRLLPGGQRSTLFDEFLIGMSTVASRISEGMLVCSGDVLLLFNALQIDFYGAGAAALSIKEKVETGKNHGVYLKDADGNVGRFLHKQTVETLGSCGAVDGRDMVDIDTGAVILRSDVLADLYELIDTEEKYRRFVNPDACLSFYADFLYPLASESTLEQFYKEKPEGSFTEELHECRTALWNVLSPYSMKLIRLSPASFIHFGTTKELLHLMTDGMEEYRFLDWSGTIHSNLAPQKYAVSNSYVSRRAKVGKGSYIEDSRIHRYSRIGEGCVVSGVTLNGETVPDHAVLHALKLKNGKFVCRMYGVQDNPKENRLFGREIRERVETTVAETMVAEAATAEEVPAATAENELAAAAERVPEAVGCSGNGAAISLWTAKLYPVCDTIEEAVRSTLALGLADGTKSFLDLDEVRGTDGEMAGWKDRKELDETFISLKDSFNQADVTAILPWQENLYEQVVAEAILENIENGVPAEKVAKTYPDIDRHTVEYLLDRAKKQDMSATMRLRSRPTTPSSGWRF
ncbi:MAG: hypothetical protein LUI13_08205 [Lachnospiraceae bacterium]|nr:hypothetical protein [Lachnospiraceae bacterium]